MQQAVQIKFIHSNYLSVQRYENRHSLDTYALQWVAKLQSNRRSDMFDGVNKIQFVPTRIDEILAHAAWWIDA